MTLVTAESAVVVGVAAKLSRYQSHDAGDDVSLPSTFSSFSFSLYF